MGEGGRRVDLTFMYHRVSRLYKYVGMSRILHRHNTLQTTEYLALGKLLRILNTTIVFYS